MSNLDDVNPKYIENILREYHAFNQINKSNIVDIFQKKEIDLYKNGMSNAINKTKKMYKQEMEQLGIADQIIKINPDSQGLSVPDPINLLYALIYIRRLSYLFIQENELDNLAASNEFIPIMIEGLYIKELTNAQNKNQLLINYENYKKALIKLCANNKTQQNNFVDAYFLQDALVTYYLEKKNDFYHYIKVNKKKKGNVEMSDILTTAQKVYKKKK